MLSCAPNTRVTELGLSADSQLIIEVKTEVKGHGVQNVLNLLFFMQLLFLTFKKTKNLLSLM